MKRKQLILLALLLLAALLLSGCGVPREGVNLATDTPAGFLQSFVVWPI